MPSVVLYFADVKLPCSASLYVVKVLRGAPPAETKDDKAEATDVCFFHTLINLSPDKIISS